MSLFKDTLRVFRNNPLLAGACMPPWGLIPEVRRWVRDEIDVWLRYVDGAVEDQEALYIERGFTPLTRTEIIKIYTDYYIRQAAKGKTP